MLEAVKEPARFGRDNRDKNPEARPYNVGGRNSEAGEKLNQIQPNARPANAPVKIGRTSSAQPSGSAESPRDSTSGLDRLHQKTVEDEKRHVERYEAMLVRIDAISRSSEFTEAYLSIGLTEKLGAMLKSEFAVALDKANEAARYQRKYWGALTSVAVLFSMLFYEVQTHAIGPTFADFMGNAKDYFSPILHSLASYTGAVFDFLIS